MVRVIGKGRRDGYSLRDLERLREEEEQQKTIQGKSAYEIWLGAGNKGTEQDFLNSLKGGKGDDGAKEVIIKEVEVKGVDGEDGVSVVNIKKSLTNDLIIKLSDGRSLNIGQLPKGEKGDTIRGDEGRGIQNISISPTHDLMVTLTDGSVLNAGYYQKVQRGSQLEEVAEAVQESI